MKAKGVRKDSEWLSTKVKTPLNNIRSRPAHRPIYHFSYHFYSKFVNFVLLFYRDPGLCKKN